ncbi:MAG: glycosyl hydrolase 115 family protein, partial [Tannerella sp.]|nr:glycosyl hydrolase 115 family protein [Tannerella sp.]
MTGRTGLFLAGLILSAGVAFGATQASGFELTGDTPWLISEEQPEALERALNDLEADWYKVFGRIPAVVKELPDDYAGAVIYLGLKGAWRNDLVKESLSDRESYVLRVQQDGRGRPALVATGADVRGSIYAAYSLSEELLGVDPWYFWTDNEPAVREQIAVPAGFDRSHGSPTFRYRGWFMNDEDLLNQFAPDPVRENVFSLEMFEKIYETILRLKGNMVAPATFPFPDERCQELAARRGLAINMHHILTLGLNTYRWPDGTPFSYSKDPGIMERYWQTCIDAFKDYEVVWTVGYRGKHDRPFWEDEPELKTPEERGAVITKAIAKQVELIRRKHPDADI